MEKQLMIIKPKTVSSKDKAKLTKKGFIVIEHPTPSEVRIIGNGDSLHESSLLMSALKGANESLSAQETFTQELYRRLSDKEKGVSLF